MPTGARDDSATIFVAVGRSAGSWVISYGDHEGKKLEDRVRELFNEAASRLSENAMRTDPEVSAGANS